MENRGFGRDEKSLLWSGVVLLVVSAGMGGVAAAGTRSVALRLAVALFGAGTGILLLLLRYHLLVTARAARMLSDSVKAHVEGYPETISIQTAAMAASELIHRHREERDGGREAASVDSLREEIRITTEA